MRESIVGFLVENCGVDSCCDAIHKSIQSGSRSWLACMNPHSYAVSLKDDHFAKSLHAADWLVPDGIGFVYASKLLGGSISERVTGFDIFSGVQQRLAASGGGRIFFMGSTEQNLAMIRAKMSREFPNLEVVGTYSPPFKDVYSASEIKEMLDIINNARPDVLWVGLTAPKQEKWLYDNFSKLNVKFAGAVGAVFDFYSGRVKRAHYVFQKLGLEWFIRLLRQPGHLWKRAYYSIPIFLLNLFRQKLGR